LLLMLSFTLTFDHRKLAMSSLAGNVLRTSVVHRAHSIGSMTFGSRMSSTAKVWIDKVFTIMLPKIFSFTSPKHYLISLPNLRLCRTPKSFARDSLASRVLFIVSRPSHMARRWLAVLHQRKEAKPISDFLCSTRSVHHLTV